MTTYNVRTFAEYPYRMEQSQRLVDEAWPKFVQNDAVGRRYFRKLYNAFPAFQFAIFDEDIMVATCNSIPIIWDLDDQTLPDRGWDWALKHGFRLAAAGEAPTTLSALSITVTRSYLGKGISSYALRAMKEIAVRHGFNALVAPVRPTLKPRYPLALMERYITWTQDGDGGAPFDPWLRAHRRAGARIVRVAPRSMFVSGTVAQWEDWTNGMKFPETGRYAVEGALNPVIADVGANRITYVEPNVWMHHPIP
jgi:GNAT superfamily N-acetyltransferase